MLDDYEEGTWTPELVGITTAGVGTYTTQSGKYTKIGNVIHFVMTVSWTEHTGTGGMQFTLPIANPAGFNQPCNAVSQSLTFANQLVAMVASGTDKVRLYTQASGAGLSTLNIDTSATVYISGSYMV